LNDVPSSPLYRYPVQERCPDYFKTSSMSFPVAHELMLNPNYP
jgi:hypothetical protein